jgi:transmembrane sensor
MATTDDLPELPPPRRDSGGEWNVDAMWEKVRARTVDAGTRGDAVPPHALQMTPVRRRAVLAAAAAILVLALGGLVLVLRPPAETPELSIAGPKPERAMHYATARGESSTIHLADGSEVVLAPESRLAVLARFANGTRTVVLDGEAMFTVRHDAARPFMVRARGALIRDVGTRFDLRAYADEPVTVAVAEGAVSMRRQNAADSGTVLNANDVGTLRTDGRVSTEHAVRLAGYIEWASGNLSFSNRPLPEVLLTIGRWYDLDVRAPDARLAARRVTAQFSKQTPEEILDALALAVDATVERNGRIVTLRPR